MRDPIYDWAKLLHSIVGNYDFLNYDLHQTAVSPGSDSPVITIEMPGHNASWAIYRELEEQLPVISRPFLELVSRHQDVHWLERLAFTHAALFASDMPFHIKKDGKEARSVAIYATGVRLLNEFWTFVHGEESSYHGLNRRLMPVAA